LEAIMAEDTFADFKQRQREIWSHFAPLETFTTPPAAHLVRVAGIAPAQRVLDVATGTGVVAVTAGRMGAQVTGIDLSPVLIERAVENAKIAQLANVSFREADAEALPFESHTFDVVTSQFGHMFAPRAELALSEMLRVLKPGGTLAFSTWPPEHLVGRLFALTSRYAPPPPVGFSPPPAWGNIDVIVARLGQAVSQVRFERGVMNFSVLSLHHYNRVIEETVGPARALAQSGDADKLNRYREELRDLAADYYADNVLRQDYLITRGVKA
jgi:SAM-dependent methyltransferase